MLPSLSWRDTGAEQALCSPVRPAPAGVGSYFNFRYRDFSEVADSIIAAFPAFTSCGDYLAFVRDELSFRFPGEPGLNDIRYVVDNRVVYNDFNAPFSQQLTLGSAGPCPGDYGKSNITGEVRFNYVAASAINQTEDSILYRWTTDGGSEPWTYYVDDPFTQLSALQYFEWQSIWPVKLPPGTYAAKPPYTDFAPKVIDPNELRVSLPSTMNLDGGITCEIFAPWLDIDAAVDYFAAAVGCVIPPPPPPPPPPIIIPGDSIKFEFGKYPGAYELVYRTNIRLQNFTQSLETVTIGKMK